MAGVPEGGPSPWTTRSSRWSSRSPWGPSRDYVRVAVIEDGNTIVGSSPTSAHSFGIGKPLGGFLTTCHGLISVPDLKIDVRSLLRACKISVFDFDHLVPGQPTFALLRVGCATGAGDGPQHRLRGIHRPGQDELPEEPQNVRYKERKLGREQGELRFEWNSADVETLRTLTSWKSDQYRRTGRVDRFAQPWIVRLLDEMHAERSETSPAS